MSATDQREPSSGAPAPAADGIGPLGLGDAPFRAILDGMLEGVFILDRDWCFAYVNDAGARHLDATPDELTGRTVFDLYPGLRGSEAQTHFQRCLDEGVPQRFEAPLPRADGERRWLEFGVQPSGEGVLVLSLDVTDRHLTADADARLHAAFESIDLIAVMLDPAGRLAFANDALCSTTGWSRSEVLGTDWFARLIPEAVRTDLRELFAQVVATGEVPRHHEHGLLTRDGRERRVVWSNTVLRDQAGAVSAVVSIGDDVTDRRDLEAGLREIGVSVQAALDASADIIAIFRPILDADGSLLDAQVVHANAAARMRWKPGVPFEEIQGHGLFELIPGLRGLVFDLYEEAVRTGQEVHAVRTVATPNGPRSTDMTITPYEGGFVHVGRDVTELRRATDELREREEELRQVLGAVEAILSWAPHEGGPLTVSPQIERIFGWRPDQITTFAAWNDLIHPDDLPACRATWSADPDAWTMEYRLRRPDGRYAWVNDRGRRVIQGGSGDRATFGVVVDVTDRVAADAALADSEERLRQTVEGLDAIVAFQEREGLGVVLSPQVERILGWKPEEIPDFTAWHALVHPDDLPRCAEVWGVEPPTWQLEYRLRRKDGSWAWVVDRARKVPTADGTGSYTFGIVVDATERHKVDEALRRGEERQRRTIEGVDAIVGIQEHAGAPLICSPQLERILGVDPKSVTTFAAWRELVHPDDLERCMALWADRPAAWEIEYRMRHADGHDVWVLDRGRRTAHEDGLGEGTFGIIVDVTERHAAAEALRVREEQLRSIIEGVDAIISYQEAWGDPVVVSPQTQRILGFPPEAVAPFDAWEAITHPDDLAGCRAAWNGPGNTWDMDYRMRRADGTWIWVNDRGRRIPHDDGRGAGMFGVVTDNTPQHEAADRLRASEARFRAMFEENPEAIGVLRPILGPDGNFLDAEFLAANRTTRERWLGGVSGELVSGTRSSGLWFTAGDDVRDAVARVAEAGLPWRSQVRTERDGVVYWTDLSIFPFEAGVAFVGRDVTERHLADDAVRNAAEFQRIVLDAMAEGLLIIEPSGRIASANARAAAVLGITPEELESGLVLVGEWGITRADGTPFPPDELPAVVTLRTGQPCRDVELNIGRPDGSHTWLRLNTEPLHDRDGTVIAAVTTFSDISAERDMSEQLRRSQRLEAVGQLAGGVAHDFNNLLAAIRGYAELAVAGMPPDTQVRADMEEIIRAADRAATLTRQLLLFSRRQVLAPRLVDPAEVVDGLIPMLRQLVGEHIELAASHDARPALVLADPGQLEQVLLNLVVNARDAMPGGGRIEVATRRVDSRAAQQTGVKPAWPAVRITVADSGNGIDPSVLPHIFEPFFTTKEAGRGSGMGLATVYGIVGASGGTVAVSTSPGRGTTFTIDLPLADDTAVALAATGPAAPDAALALGLEEARRGTVLLVEDDGAVRAILARQLAGLGWRVDDHPSGTAAAAAASAAGLAKPDILVTDVRMPGMQGPDLARRLRSIWPGLPVLFVTGLADEVGADPDESWMHVLSKPFDANQLARAIDAALGDDT